MFKSIFFFLFSLQIPCAMAFPSHLEVWFLKPQLNSDFNGTREIEVENKILYSQKNLCLPYGEDCFDPQIGIYPHPNKVKNSIIGGGEGTDNNTNTLGVKNSLQSDLIDCDKNYYFDLFCGKSKAPLVSDVSLEIWVDISSSFRELENISADGKFCKRREFVESVKRECGDSTIEVMVFDTSFKSVVDLSQVCVTRGLNDRKRMMSWLENSQAKNMIFITDINEASPDFEGFLRSRAAKVWESKTFNDLLAESGRISNLCKKKK